MFKFRKVPVYLVQIAACYVLLVLLHNIWKLGRYAYNYLGQNPDVLPVVFAVMAIAFFAFIKLIRSYR